MSRMFRKLASVALVCMFFVGVGVVLHAFLPSIAYAAPDTTGGDVNYSSGFLNWIGGFLAQVINFIGDAIGSLTLVIIEVVVINILNYNNFASSSIVTLGWTITRDMVNMFAVIVLLILAVKTMISRGGGAWQQHLPRFFLGIVFANFSRTLCGLAVDASQVVMMTFVNALMGIAAGNFAQLMVMPQATTYSTDTLTAATEAGATVITLATNIANAYVKLIVQVAVMVVILLLAVAFLWRIVTLWIAFIMAPLAGFSWGSMDIVKFLAQFWNAWAAQFVPPLVLGPMLAFFLYLALAASSNGNLAKAEAFPEPEETTTYGSINLSIFESTNFTGLLIAIVFLVLGVKESAKISAKMGGLAAMAINDKTTGRALRLGRTISGKALASPITGTRVAGQLFGATGRGLASNSLATTNLMSSSPNLNAALRRVGRVGQWTGGKMNALSDNKAAELAKKGLQMAESPLENSLRGAKAGGKFAGRAVSAVGAVTGLDSLMKAGSAIDAKFHDLDEKEKKAAKDRVAHMNDTQKVVRLMNAVNGNGEITNEILADAKTLRGELFTNKDFAKQLKAQVGDVKFDEIVQDTLGEFDHDESHRSIDKDAWNKARSQYVDLYANAGGDVKKFIDSDDFNGRLMRAKAAEDATITAALAAASTGKTENGRVVTKLDELHRGNYGGENVRAAVPGAVAAGNVDNLTRLMGRGGAERLTTANLTNAAVIQGIIQGNAARGDIASEEVAAEVERRREAARRAGTLAAFNPVAEQAGIRATVQQQFTTNVMQTQEVENITKAFSNGQFDESHINDAMFDDTRNPNADRAVQAMARAANVDFSKMSAATRDQINVQLAAMEAAGGRISNDDANEIRKKLVAAGKTVGDVIPGVNPDPATNPSMNLSGNEKLKAQQLFKADPSTIGQIKRAIDEAVSSGRNDFSRTVVEGLTKEDFTKLSDMMRKETNATKKAVIKEAMETINKALSVHERTAASPDELKRLKGLRSSYNAADRYMT